MTQTRLVQNPAYDPLYHNTQEAVGESFDPEKDTCILDTAIRGVREECGLPDWVPAEVLSEDYTTGKGDRYLVTEPLCFTESLADPQPWFGPTFLFEVGPDFEPDPTQKDGEAGDVLWWDPEDLFKQMAARASDFMGLHVPSLKLACEFYR